MNKYFQDRLNCLKSNLKSAKGYQMDKINNEYLIGHIEGQIFELNKMKTILINKGWYIE